MLNVTLDKVELCNGTEIVWVCKVRLGLDNLVEVPYRDHVILKIEGITPNVKQALRINLRSHRDAQTQENQYLNGLFQ